MRNSGMKSTAGDDEVEQLLRAAEDDMLLKLSLNSHMARASTSAAIDPDLDRRFQALKKPTKIIDSTKTKLDTGSVKGDGDGAAAPADDLFARFANLKNSRPSHTRNENKSCVLPSDESVDQKVKEEEDDDDEVDKIIKWAIDAARLDPSPSSDDDDPFHSSDDDDDDVVELRDDKGKKGKRR